MNNSNNIILKVHQISENGINSYQCEEDFISQEEISKTPVFSGNLNFSSHYNSSYFFDNKVNFNFHYSVDQSDIIVKLGEVDDLNPTDFATEISTVLDEIGNYKSFINSNVPLNKSKRESNMLNTPTMIKCQNCDTNFPTKYQYQRHQCEFNAEKVVVHSAKALVIHSRAHQSLKPYVCEQCGRSYSQTSHLWQHMRFHQGIKPFACPHEGCEARYTIRPDLKDHIRKVHTRERPFKCAVCNKCFLTGSVYYQHRLIHTNDRRYGCDICGKRFFRADALNNHRRIHTDERPYPCIICGREFRQKGDRNKHVRTQHPE